MNQLKDSFEANFPNIFNFVFVDGTYGLSPGQDYDQFSVQCLEYRSAWRAWQSAYKHFITDAPVVAGVIKLDEGHDNFPQFYLTDVMHDLPNGDYKLILQDVLALIKSPQGNSHKIESVGSTKDSNTELDLDKLNQFKALFLQAPESQLSKQCVSLIAVWDTPAPRALQVLAVIDWAVFTGGASDFALSTLEQILNKLLSVENLTHTQLAQQATWRETRDDVYSAILARLKELK